MSIFEALRGQPASFWGQKIKIYTAICMAKGSFMEIWNNHWWNDCGLVARRNVREWYLLDKGSSILPFKDISMTFYPSVPPPIIDVLVTCPIKSIWPTFKVFPHNRLAFCFSEQTFFFFSVCVSRVARDWNWTFVSIPLVPLEMLQ